MGNENKDVLRVCTTEAALETQLREKMFGFATDTHRILAKAPGGTVYKFNSISSSLISEDGNSVSVTKDVDNADFEALKFVNSNVPASGETGQSVTVGFYTYADIGGVQSVWPLAKITAGKNADYYDASTDDDCEANLQFKVDIGGELSEVGRFSSDWSFTVFGPGSETPPILRITATAPFGYINNGELGDIDFVSKNAVGTYLTYAQIGTMVRDAAAGGEDGLISFRVATNGVLASKLAVRGGDLNDIYTNAKITPDSGTQIINGSLSLIDAATLGLGSGKGGFLFSDLATDTITVQNANFISDTIKCDTIYANDDSGNDTWMSFGQNTTTLQVGNLPMIYTFVDGNTDIVHINSQGNFVDFKVGGPYGNALWHKAYKKCVLTALRWEQAKGADVASANDITLGGDGNYFVITGTTDVQRILTADWQAGSIIILRFSGALTLHDQHASGSGYAGFFLTGQGGDRTVSADSVGTFIYDGTYWREIAWTQIPG
jgi:hypothetical protein